MKRGALQRAGEPVDGSSNYDALCTKYLNQMHFNIISGSNEFDVDCGEVWSWAKARSPLILNMKAAVGSTGLGGVGGGTVSVANGSASGTFSIAPVDSMKDQFLWVDDSNPEKYRITAHIAGDTTFTLDGSYNGATNSAGSFLVLRIVYPIGTQDQILRLVEPFRMYKTTFDEDRDYQIFGLDSNSFHHHFPLTCIVGGVPNRFFTFINEDEQICVQFNEFLTEDTRCEIDYIPPPEELTDTNESIPLIPRAFRPALEYGATAMIMLDKSDDRTPFYVNLTQSKLKALVQSTRKEQSNVNSKSKGMFFPRQEQIRVRQRLTAFIRQRD